MGDVDRLLAGAARRGRVRGRATRQQRALQPVTGDHIASQASWNLGRGAVTPLEHVGGSRLGVSSGNPNV